MDEYGLSFSVGHSAAARELARTTGAFVSAEPLFVQSNGFVLGPDETQAFPEPQFLRAGDVGAGTAFDATGVDRLGRDALGVLAAALRRFEMAQLTVDRTESIAIPARTMSRVIVALRIFFGVNWLSNAVAKLIGVNTFHWGFVTFNLVDRSTAHAIAHQAATSTSIAPLRWFYTNAVLPNWGFFQWFLTVAEFAVAIGLLLGIATRLAALGGLLLIGPIWIMLLTTNQYFWTYPLDLIPLVLLACVPAGRMLGFDRALATRFGGRWPF